MPPRQGCQKPSLSLSSQKNREEHKPPCSCTWENRRYALFARAFTLFVVCLPRTCITHAYLGRRRVQYGQVQEWNVDSLTLRSTDMQSPHGFLCFRLACFPISVRIMVHSVVKWFFPRVVNHVDVCCLLTVFNIPPHSARVTLDVVSYSRPRFCRSTASHCVETSGAPGNPFASY